MNVSTTGMTSLFGCDPATYSSHEVHTGDRTYRETNCYTDIQIEMLHARRDEPLAAMGFTVRMDFEGDQWTFFKPPPEGLELLFGVDVHEMQPYRPLPQQIQEQIESGRTMIVELDSWYLPDTASTSYRTEHVKTSAVMEAIDQAGERLRYFHNASLYELDGEDYRGVFRVGGSWSEDVLPPYTELVRFDAGPRLAGEELRAAALDLLRHHLARRPRTNPFERFCAALAEDLPGLLEGDAEDYHAYAFATVRMVGSAFEVCASHVDWLLGDEAAGASEALWGIVPLPQARPASRFRPPAHGGCPRRGLGPGDVRAGPRRRLTLMGLGRPDTQAGAAGTESRRLDEGWELAAASANSICDPGALDGLTWRRADVPGTVAGALGAERDLDAEDWWFRTTFQAEPAAPGEEVVLRLGGVATVADVHLNGHLILLSESMFVEHEVDVGGLLRGDNELAIRCRALGPLLAERRKPRARWRTRLVSEGNLRFFRTMLLGRAPGFAPGPSAVGPWRPVTLERRRGLVLEELALRPRLEEGVGVLSVSGALRSLTDPEPTGQIEVEVEDAAGTHTAALSATEADGRVVLAGELSIPGVAPWWPHTHGEPALHGVRLVMEEGPDRRVLHTGRIGFRSLTPGSVPGLDPEAAGLDLHVNGVPVFARGALWTPADWPGLAPDEDELRGCLQQVCDAGMNMLRLAGTGAYESSTFYDLCDELGLLVWQDFMFANLDYPIADEQFRALVEREAEQVLAQLSGRPSLAALCGNSEVEQQVAMLGLDPELGRGELFGDLLPRLARQAGADAIYLPSAPCGGYLPFRPDTGVASYFGVGGYRRPLEDVRRAEVRFASECLAIANVPDAVPAPVHDPSWKQGVPRDTGSGWDFDDVSRPLSGTVVRR